MGTKVVGSIFYIILELYWIGVFKLNNVKQIEFYEKMFVARLLGEELLLVKNKKLDEQLDMRDLFSLVAGPGDVDTIDYMWLNIASGRLTWGDHLCDIIFPIINLQHIPQPWHGDMRTPHDVKMEDVNYAKYYTEIYKPKCKELLNKYIHSWEPRLETRIVRGMRDIVRIIKERYGLEEYIGLSNSF